MSGPILTPSQLPHGSTDTLLRQTPTPRNGRCILIWILLWPLSLANIILSAIVSGCRSQRADGQRRHMASWLVLFLCVNTLTACMQLPPRRPVDVSHTLSSPTKTPLQQLVENEARPYPGLSGYHVLSEPIEAFAARLLMIEKAQSSVDIQYYIWRNDTIGSLMMDALIRAADRGVRVRLLLDDNNSGSLDTLLASLNLHPNIEVRLFNPYTFRNTRILDYLFNFPRINRRMHNKVILADQAVGLLGGRNISDKYFNAGPGTQFSDIDVMVAGPITKEMNDSFDLYWNHRAAYPIQDVLARSTPILGIANLRKQLALYSKNNAVQNYLEQTSDTDLLSNWLTGDLGLHWAKARLIVDHPDKILNRARRNQRSDNQLERWMGSPLHSMDIISAYFIAGKLGTRSLIDIADHGIKIRVLTNSYAATDVGLVHAFYSKRRAKLLKHGIELYEFKAVSDQNNHLSSRLHLRQTGDASLHAKMLAIDDKRAFIGSFNVDPRSANLNTEIGVVFDSPSMARSVSDAFNPAILGIAYQVSLDDQGRLQWKEADNNGEIYYHDEPDIGFFQRIGLKLLGLLPLENLL